ncbi:right-handed parallel beta-helix repeat-containing protein [Pseudarthrobacter sp. BIM B-2242]|uniref:NosD domain-containing protein n=1 Tax=Pseudarthrobacter sp. BIM B-2242 TaxID=2772401 RepID=UPI00168BF49E|nr:right-handed parallel beta-helix repeat-containing protein [Pseudarthrobacter sp. BIM B-2242]QOD05694.1 right-handed parallel beta-helix repeat-containing protein [Pseudarthrobacter sp. BIM B-2242]
MTENPTQPFIASNSAGRVADAKPAGSQLKRRKLLGFGAFATLVAGFSAAASLGSAAPAAATTGLTPDARDYGAVGDGSSDDTEPLKKWLAAGGSELTDGVFRITSGLTLLGDNRTFCTRNARIVADQADITALTVQGANTKISAHIDGNNKANIGLKISGPGATVESSTIENFYSKTTAARGVEVTTGGGCTVRDNLIRNVGSLGDTTLGNGNGSARAILLSNSGAASQKSVIAGNTIDNVFGEEGDAIQILFYDAAASINASADVTISGNDISNVSRRFIKVQASNVRIVGNTLGHAGVTPANPSNSIDVIRGDDVTISDNRIAPNPLGVVINVVGSAGFLCRRVVIRDNVIRQDDEKKYTSMFLNYLSQAVVRDNTIFGGGTAIAIGNSTVVSVQGNIHHGGDSAATSFSANSTNTGVVMLSNVNMNSARKACTANTSVGALTEMNVSRT